MPSLSPARPRLRRLAVGIAFAPDHLFLRVSDGRWTRTHQPPNWLTASPTEPNLASSTEAARAVRTALTAVAGDSRHFGHAVIALPDRAAHASLAENPNSGGTRKLRSELVHGLGARSGPGSSDPDGRFRFGTLVTGTLRRRSTLGAVSAAPVVQQYETAVETAGLRVRWVDATSLALLPEWLAASDGGDRTRILLLLHRHHFVVAAASGRRLTGFRMKLRAALDPDPPALAVRRLAESGSFEAQVWGDGAVRAAQALRAAGCPPDEVRDTGDGESRASVSPVTGSALGALLRRVGARPAPLLATPTAAAANQP